MLSKILATILKCAVIFGLISISQLTQASEYLLKYRNSFFPLNLKSPHLKVLSTHPPGQLIKIEIDESNSKFELNQLLTQPNVEYVVPDSKVFALNAFLDISKLKEQWALSKIKAEKAWLLAGNKGSRKVIVAVIDTGADYKHVSLAPNMIKGYDFIHNNENPMDVVSYGFPGHGTHCSGIVGATGLVEGGTIGISPEVSILPLRFIDEDGGEISNAIRAIDFAIEKKVDVISASWGGEMSRADARPLIEAIARAEKAGIVFVSAASNDGKNNDTFEVYPANANLSNTISVAASDKMDSRPSWSNFGHNKVNIAAPGDEILSTIPGSRYGSISGTSMAAPLVAGLVALVKAQDANLNPMELRSLLQATSDKVNIDTACDCRINAFNAIDLVKTKKMFISPFAGSFHVGEKIQFEAVYGKAPFSFSSTNSMVASIDSLSGVLSAMSEGETTISATDASGLTRSSYKIYIIKSQP